MNEQFEKWDPVLKRITESFPSFLMYLAEDLIHGLVFNPTMESSQNASAEAMFLWLTHLLTSQTWESHQPFCPRSYILSACDESPNHWAKLLGQKLQNSGSKKSKVEPKKNFTKAIGRNGADAQSTPSSITQLLGDYGWETVGKWDSRPLGVTATR